MSDNDQAHDSEVATWRIFDPDDMSQWKDYSPDEFIAVIVHELKREKEVIEKYVELMRMDAGLRSSNLNINGQNLSVEFCFQTLLKATRIMNRLLDTTWAYGEMQRQRKN